MTWIKEEPIGQLIGGKYFKLTEPFIFQSDILEETCVIEPEFICDLESVPILRGTCRIGGIIHDYLCRIDSEPVVTKKQAADVYKEFMLFRGNSWVRANAKYWAVRVAFGYFHKFKVLDHIKNK